MEIKTSEIDGVFTILVRGDMGYADHEPFVQLLKNARKYAQIRIDLSQIDYINSVFVNAITAFRNEFPAEARRIRLIHPSANVMDVLRTTSMDMLFQVIQKGEE